MALTREGYHFHLEGGQINYEFTGKGLPDSEMVSSLFEVIKNGKDEAIIFLKIYCPRCGGCFFWGDKLGELHCYGCEPPGSENASNQKIKSDFFLKNQKENSYEQDQEAKTGIQ